MDQPTLSVVIPALNEEGRVGKAVAAVHRVLSEAGISHEVIVVDDGSSDRTSPEAESASARLIRHQTVQGKGAAVTDGMAVSIGEFVAFIDADLEYPAEALPAMVKRAQVDPHGRTCTVAQRTQDERSLWERATSHVARMVAGAVLRIGVRDTQAGLKLFPGWFAREVLAGATERGWMFDVEALLLARKHGLRVYSHPVTQRSVRPRRASAFHMAKTGVRFLRLAATHSAMVAETARILRFILVGGLNTAVDLTTFLVLVALHPPGNDGLIASAYAAAGWGLASVVGYAMHTRWTFRRTMHPVGFYVFSLVGLGIQTGCVGLAARLFGTGGAIVGKIVGVSGAGLVTYVGYRMVAQKGRVLVAVTEDRDRS